MEEMIKRLRAQSFFLNFIADKLESGESIEDYLWTVDEALISELMQVKTVEQESEAALKSANDVTDWVISWVIVTI